MWKHFNEIQINQSQTYLFTCLITSQLYEYLRNDYHFEIVLRYYDLKQQVKIRGIRDYKLRVKSVVNGLFTRIVLNFIISKLSIERGIESKDQNKDQNKDQSKDQRKDQKFNPFDQLKFQYNEFGKPFLYQQKELQFTFNASTSNDLISLVVEITSDPIGIDLSHSSQSISSTNFMNEFNDIFDESEIHQLLALEQTRRYKIFNQFWTLKEAFTKLIGSGLNIDLRHFYFHLNENYIIDDSTIDFEKPMLIYPFPINWKSGIQVNTTKLKNHQLITSLPSSHFNCRSGTLINSDPELPVIVSIINQRDSEIQSYNINFLLILESYIFSTD